MPRYSEALWERARELVVVEGLDYEEASRATGISLSSVQKRAAREKWQEARSEYIESNAAYKSKVREFKNGMLDTAMESNDPQDVHAWLSVERAFPEHRYGELGEGEKRSLVAIFIEQTVAHLSERDANALKALTPHIRDLAEHLLKADWSS